MTGSKCAAAPKQIKEEGGLGHMLILVTGGSGSGKSEIAESIAVSLHRDKPYGALIYLATMHRNPDDPELERKISRHRTMREGKGFLTCECERDITRVLKSVVFSAAGGGVVLIEDIPNLAANECFDPERMARGTEMPDAETMKALVADPLFAFRRIGADVVAVTGEVFSDGLYETYGEETKRYIEILGGINRSLAEAADCVVEAVCGIPCLMKGYLKTNRLRY